MCINAMFPHTAAALATVELSVVWGHRQWFHFLALQTSLKNIGLLCCFLVEKQLIKLNVLEEIHEISEQIKCYYLKYIMLHNGCI